MQACSGMAAPSAVGEISGMTDCSLSCLLLALKIEGHVIITVVFLMFNMLYNKYVLT